MNVLVIDLAAGTAGARPVVNAIVCDAPPDDTEAFAYRAEAEGGVIGATWDGEVFTPPVTEPARRLIAKSLVQERVHAIGKLGDAFTALQSQPIYFGRWFAPDWPNVYADDEGLLAILVAIGCSPAEIETITAP
jgi:hypothetical protein